MKPRSSSSLSGTIGEITTGFGPGGSLGTDTVTSIQPLASCVVNVSTAGAAAIAAGAGGRTAGLHAGSAARRMRSTMRIRMTVAPGTDR